MLILPINFCGAFCMSLNAIRDAAFIIITVAVLVFGTEAQSKVKLNMKLQALALKSCQQVKKTWELSLI